MVVILFLNFISVWAITQAGKLSARILGKTFNWRSFNKSRQQLTLRCCNAKCYRLVKIKLPNQYCNFNLMDSMPLINVKALVKEWSIKSSTRRYNFKRLPQNYPLTFQGDSAHGPRHGWKSFWGCLSKFYQFGQIWTYMIGPTLKKDQPQLPFTQDGPHTEGCTTKFVEGSFSFPGICNGEVQT